MQFSPDMKSALTDAILTAWGTPPCDAHPQAINFKDGPLSKLATFCGEFSQRPGQHDTPRSIMNRGMGTADFGDTLAKAAQTFALRRYQLAAAYLSFCGKVEAADFRPVEVADISVGTALRLVSENSEIQAGRVTMQNATNAQLLSFASNLVFSRQIVVNDQSSLVATNLTAFGNAAATTEGRLVYAALEENPAMSDGGPVFHADYGNFLGALDGTSLAGGMAALRGGMSGHEDDIPDLAAAHLIVSAGMEYAARKLVRDADLLVAVTASAHLPAGHWYLLPDPQIQPVVSTILLKGSTNPLRLESTPTPIEIDGFSIRAAADLGAVMVSRHAIRGQA